MTLKELEAYASVSGSTLKKWMKLGMPYYKLGCCIRVKISEFDEWFKQFRSDTKDMNHLDSVWDEVMQEV